MAPTTPRREMPVNQADCMRLSGHSACLSGRRNHDRSEEDGPRLRRQPPEASARRRGPARAATGPLVGPVPLTRLDVGRVHGDALDGLALHQRADAVLPQALALAGPPAPTTCSWTSC